MTKVYGGGTQGGRQLVKMVGWQSRGLWQTGIGVRGYKGSEWEGHPSKDSEAGIQSTELAGVQRRSWAQEDVASDC